MIFCCYIIRAVDNIQVDTRSTQGLLTQTPGKGILTQFGTCQVSQFGPKNKFKIKLIHKLSHVPKYDFHLIYDINTTFYN
jgi:hypothetical protein